jgi:hypothetical protein
MKNEKTKKINKQSLPAGRQGGAAMLISTVFFLFISLAIIFGLVSPAVRELKNSSVNLNSKKSYFLAESGSEDAMYRILNGMEISASEVITLDSNSVTTTINTLIGDSKEIISLGDVSNYQRKTSVLLTLGVGTAFSFGVQSGNGGFIMYNNAGVNGNVYSNGTILGDSGTFITGSAISAGPSGLIDDVNVGTVGTDEAWANDVTNTNVTGPLYCQSGSGNNKACDTSRPDAEEQDYPITDANITEWKAAAEAGGVIAGNYNVGSSGSLGPKKITGNLTFSNSKTLTLTGPVWVVGTITTANNSVVRVDPSYGVNSEVFLSDGKISLSNNTDFQGSGTAGSYILLLTTNSNNGGPGAGAIEVSNNAGTVILNAQNGRINFSNNSGANQATAETIFLDNNATVTYESGLVDVHFTSGPGGGYSIDNWEEAE